MSEQVSMSVQQATQAVPVAQRADPRKEWPQTPYRPAAARLTRVPALYALAHRVELARFRRHLPYPTGPARVVDRRASRLRVIDVDPDVTARSAARINLELVADLCERAGIEYFVVPEPNSRRDRIGIEDGQWDAFVDAVLALGRTQPLYLGVGARTRHGHGRWSELSTDDRIARAARTQSEIEVFRLLAPAPDGREFGRTWACLVERWTSDELDRLCAPSRNARAQFVARSLAVPTVIERAGRPLRSLQLFSSSHVFDVDFPVDAVYLWVDGDDPAWQARKAAALGTDAAPLEADATSDARFRDGGELRYSMRSVHRFAPWIRRIFLVTDQQRPSWLDVESDRITMVDHRELFGDDGALPTFNSHAIGARLHHIEGLSEHYLYFNDDVFIGRDVSPSLFFEGNGLSRFFLSRSSLGFSDESTVLSHESARRNVARLIERDFGKSPTNTFFHSPIPQRRSIMADLEARYPDEFATTWRNQFRSHTDVEPNSWLHNYYGYLTGRAVPGSIRYDYIQLGDPTAEARLARLLRTRDKDVFCLNDHPDATRAQQAYAARWLAEYFSEPAPFER